MILSNVVIGLNDNWKIDLLHDMIKVQYDIENTQSESNIPKTTHFLFSKNGFLILLFAMVVNFFIKDINFIVVLTVVLIFTILVIGGIYNKIKLKQFEVSETIFYGLTINACRDPKSINKSPVVNIGILQVIEESIVEIINSKIGVSENCGSLELREIVFQKSNKLYIEDKVVATIPVLLTAKQELFFLIPWKVYHDYHDNPLKSNPNVYSNVIRRIQNVYMVKFRNNRSSKEDLLTQYGIVTFRQWKFDKLEVPKINGIPFSSSDLEYYDVNCIICYDNMFEDMIDDIPDDDPFVLLTCCFSFAHESHIHAWLAHNDYCPYCKAEKPDILDVIVED